MNPTDWRAAHPELFFLDPADLPGLARWLAKAGVLVDSEAVRDAARAGEGNMNCTVRVSTDRRSLIVKQARPWVEKYPQFEAPWDRALREMEFFETVRDRVAVAARLPCLLHADAAARVLVMEDIGRAGDYTDLYHGAMLAREDVRALAGWLGALHMPWPPGTGRRGLANREMRALNSAHIFSIPLKSDNGLDLDAITPGLAAEAHALLEDRAFVDAVETLAAIYLADGESLVHGDFFPGSFLRSADGPRIIDTEFAFFGRPEFDPGVFLAHLKLARQPGHLLEAFLAAYAPPAGFDEAVMLRLAGVEIMRRLIGYAQLPLPYATDEKRRLLALARDLVLAPSGSRLLEG